MCGLITLNSIILPTCMIECDTLYGIETVNIVSRRGVRLDRIILFHIHLYGGEVRGATPKLIFILHLAFYQTYK